MKSMTSTLDKCFGTLSKKYHPDRFGKVSTVEKDLIVEVYSQINDLHMVLQDEELRAELKKAFWTLKEEVCNMSVTMMKRSLKCCRLKVCFSFVRRNTLNLLKMLDKAFEINPTNWRTNTMRVRCQTELER